LMSDKFADPCYGSEAGGWRGRRPKIGAEVRHQSSPSEIIDGESDIVGGPFRGWLAVVMVALAGRTSGAGALGTKQPGLPLDNSSRLFWMRGIAPGTA